MKSRAEMRRKGGDVGNAPALRAGAVPVATEGTPLAPRTHPMVPPPLRHQPPVIVPGLPVARPRPPRPARDLTLVLGAIPQETELVAWALVRKSRREFAGFPFIEGLIDGRRVIVAVTGIGKTNATLITTLFAEKFRPREVLMCGTASRIDAAIRNGDVIVGEVTCNHDMGSLGVQAQYGLDRMIR